MKLMSLINEDDDRIRGRNRIFENILPKTTVPSDDIPIKIKKSDWEHLQNPERLSRTFSFNGQAQVLKFVAELLRYERKSQHNAIITIDHTDVTIVAYTRDLDKVTDLDVEYTRECEYIYGEML